MGLAARNCGLATGYRVGGQGSRCEVLPGYWMTVVMVAIMAMVIMLLLSLRDIVNIILLQAVSFLDLVALFNGCYLVVWISTESYTPP